MKTKGLYKCICCGKESRQENEVRCPCGGEMVYMGIPKVIRPGQVWAFNDGPRMDIVVQVSREKIENGSKKTAMVVKWASGCNCVAAREVMSLWKPKGFFISLSGEEIIRKDSNSLLSCPHCGSHDVVDVIHWVECKRCGCHGPRFGSYSWNNRARPTRTNRKPYKR